MGSLNIEISDADAEGICLARVFKDGEYTGCFETTQAEIKVLMLELGGYAVPAEFLAAAEIAEARRIDLGRTLEEEIVTLATINISVPAAEARADVEGGAA